MLLYISFDWWMRAFVVLGLVFSIPDQEIGLWKCRRGDFILCRVGSKTTTRSVSYLACHRCAVAGGPVSWDAGGGAGMDRDAGQAAVCLAVGERHVVDERHARPHVQATSPPATLRPFLRPVHRDRAKPRRAFAAVWLVRAIAPVAQATCSSLRRQAVQVFPLRSSQRRTVHGHVRVVAVPSSTVAGTMDRKLQWILLLAVKGSQFL